MSPFWLAREGQLSTWLEDRHRRNVVMANARQRARDEIFGHGAVTTKQPSSTYADGGVVRSTPAPHPSPRPDEPKGGNR